MESQKEWDTYNPRFRLNSGDSVDVLCVRGLNPCERHPISPQEQEDPPSRNKECQIPVHWKPSANEPNRWSWGLNFELDMQ